MADAITDLHRPFVEAIARHQQDLCSLPITVSEMTMLVGVLHERLRHRSQQDPARRSLERILAACLHQLDALDPVIGQWLRLHKASFDIETVP